MAWIKRMVWGGAAVIVLCIFALMLLVWQLGNMRKRKGGAMHIGSAPQERRSVNG